jgi:CMP-N-acetylneuraminic acid synthetase
MKIVQVLLARCNYCKRIPNKPLVKLGEVHLIEWTLSVMRTLPYESHVYSDNKQVRELAENYGCYSHPKLYENEKGIHYTRDELKVYNQDLQANIIVMYQLTSPFRNIPEVQKWIEDFPVTGADCALTVKKVEPDVFYKSNGDRIWPEYRTYQNKQELYRETGSVYIFWKKQIEKQHLTLGNRKLLIDPYGFDIDTFSDLKKAETFILSNKGGIV